MKEKLKNYNQEHLYKYYNDLGQGEKEKLDNQIERTDFEYVNMFTLQNEHKQENTIQPINVLNLQQIAKNEKNYNKIGKNAIKQGKLGVLLLAGGMGTRLGSDKPKGMYNIGVTKDLYIFECLFDTLKKVCKECNNVKIPLFIMTSELNDNETREFLKEKNYFGYDENYIRFFVQEMAPCVDKNGKILLETKSKIATSPNGNGGWYNSLLKDTSARQMLVDSKIEYINFFGVDNVLAKIADCVYFGALIDGDYDCGAKVIKKTYPDEKVGVVCLKNGVPSIIEYMDFPLELARLRDESGNAVYNYGSILNFIFKVDILNKIKDEKLPLHIVNKKIPYLNEQGKEINPDMLNGYKFEYLNTDLVEKTKSCLVFEVEREKEFAPIKNKTGVDSVESARELLTRNGYKI